MTTTTANTFSFTLNPMGEYTKTYPTVGEAMIAANEIVAKDLAKYEWAYAIPVALPNSSPGIHPVKYGIDIIDLQNIDTIGSV